MAKTTAAKAARANAAKPAIAPESATTRIGYEVVGTLNMGRVNGELQVRSAGETVYEDELGTEMTQHLLGKGEIADRNKPIPPSQAEKVLAFEHLLDVARQVGAVQIDGGEYRLAGDEATYKGLIEFRKGVSIDQLKTAIVAKFKG